MHGGLAWAPQVPGARGERPRSAPPGKGRPSGEPELPARADLAPFRWLDLVRLFDPHFCRAPAVMSPPESQWWREWHEKETWSDLVWNFPPYCDVCMSGNGGNRGGSCVFALIYAIIVLFNRPCCPSRLTKLILLTFCQETLLSINSFIQENHGDVSSVTSRLSNGGGSITLDFN